MLRVVQAASVVATVLACSSSPAQVEMKVDSTAPLKTLLAKPKDVPNLPALLDTNLNETLELMLCEPISNKVTEDEAFDRITSVIAEINRFNKEKPDGFIEALRSHRDDLSGLPFRVGSGRASVEESVVFKKIAADVHDHVGATSSDLWKNLRTKKADILAELNKAGMRAVPITVEDFHRAAVAAPMQILGRESKDHRIALAIFLSELDCDDSALALVKLALYSPEEDVCAAAILALRKRQPKQYADALMEGFRYPLPAVAQRAGRAVAGVERKDFIPNLLKVLESPDPRLPFKQVVRGQEVDVVRELVRVNHHRNCLLCHAPGNTLDVPEGVLKAAVPLPTEPLDGLAPYQENPRIRVGIVVRLDTTYLRQDFSMMLPVRDAAPWPAMQRFDFFVRSRQISPKLAQEWQRVLTESTKHDFSAYHRAAAFALQKLTGYDGEPTAEAWKGKLQRATP